MNYDITFCLNETCEAKECMRHRSRIPVDTPVSVSNFDCPYEPVVTIVRCKDCQFAKFNPCNETLRCTTHNGMNRTVGEHEFCSYGERMGDYEQH